MRRSPTAVIPPAPQQLLPPSRSPPGNARAGTSPFIFSDFWKPGMPKRCQERSRTGFLATAYGHSSMAGIWREGWKDCSASEGGWRVIDGILDGAEASAGTS